LNIVKPREQVDFELNRRLLNRYRFVEQETLRMLAGWLPATARMELKLAMGRWLWEDAQHVQQFYQRLKEVQKPAFQSTGDPALELCMEEVRHAPDAEAFLTGILRVIKPALIAAYRWHLTQTFANADAPTLYVLRHILLDEEEQVRQAGEVLGHVPASEWETYVAGLLAAAGGVTGQAERAEPPAPSRDRTSFVPPRQAARDDRFTVPDRSAAGSMVSDPDSERLGEFESYSREMLAAETVALVLFLTPNMPWQFTYDAARHCYDETRHCKLGIDWLTQHGVDYTCVSQMTRIYAWRSQYAPATQYALLTMGNEAHVFPYRHKRLAAYRASGDTLSTQFVSYDIADERNHVAYGRRWLPELMARFGIKKDVKEFVDDTVRCWEEEYRSGLLPLHNEQ
jgi:hypothetical protein